ncbi:MAG: chromosomal replication initiator protein DnaA [Clostridia bacterium]|nr:chromosomal replication initiator protein DnaA [Clostridia bacterium]
MINVNDNTQFNEIWALVRDKLQEINGYDNIVMKLWFNDLKMTVLTNDTAVFMANSDFKRDIVYNRYLDKIKEALFEVIGFEVSVSVRSLQNEKETTEKIEAAAEKNDVPKAEIYSTVGESKVLNRAAVPAAFAEFTFDSFVVGESNKFAHAAAQSVSNHPARQANPLFIYGPSGLGKTHLLYAIANKLKENFPSYKVVYVKGEEFLNQMIDSISRAITHEFREKYRQADVLLIDDIHFIAGKASAQEEFFNTFNHLYENGKQIILVSDVPPRDIDRLEERLRTRFECGVIADINPPDFELRAAIVKKKVEKLGVTFPEEVINYIAENLTDNVRQLEGAVKRISAQCILTGAEVSVDLAIRCISDQVVGSEPVTVTIDKILSMVSQKYGITVDDLKSRKRTSNIASARHISVYIIKKLTDRSLPAIGRVFGRDHTTIINSIETVEKRMATESAFDAEIKDLINRIKKR